MLRIVSILILVVIGCAVLDAATAAAGTHSTKTANAISAATE